MVRYKLVVEFTVTEPRPPQSLEEATNNVRDGWLVSIGCPKSVIIEARGISLEVLKEERSECAITA